MGLFDWFKNWAQTSNRSIPAPRHPDRHPINVPKLAQELRHLRDEAKRLGAGGITAAAEADRRSHANMLEVIVHESRERQGITAKATHLTRGAA